MGSAKGYFDWNLQSLWVVPKVKSCFPIDYCIASSPVNHRETFWSMIRQLFLPLQYQLLKLSGTHWTRQQCSRSRLTSGCTGKDRIQVCQLSESTWTLFEPYSDESSSRYEPPGWPWTTKNIWMTDSILWRTTCQAVTASQIRIATCACSLNIFRKGLSLQCLFWWWMR